MGSIVVVDGVSCIGMLVVQALLLVVFVVVVVVTVLVFIVVGGGSGGTGGGGGVGFGVCAGSVGVHGGGSWWITEVQ